MESKVNCDCQTVKLYDGVWQCMLCRRKFIPLDSITRYSIKRDLRFDGVTFEEAEEQKPVEEPDDSR